MGTPVRVATPAELLHAAPRVCNHGFPARSSPGRARRVQASGEPVSVALGSARAAFARKLPQLGTLIQPC